jgi:hypothetical protein
MGNTGTDCSQLETLNTIEINSAVHGHVIIDVREYLKFTAGYEEEMRRQPSNLFYIQALKDDMQVELTGMMSDFEKWKASTRIRANSEAVTMFGKDKPSINDIEAVLILKPEWGKYNETIAEATEVCNLLSDLVQALTHKKIMLEQLAQYERSGMSQYPKSIS